MQVLLYPCGFVTGLWCPVLSTMGLKISKKDKDGIETLESGKKSHRRPCGI